VIICSCNVLSEAQVLATLKLGAQARPQSTAQTYRCLGCAPRCGRCVETVRALLVKAHLEHCQVGCAACPAGEHHHDAGHQAHEAKRPALMPELATAK
jgi:bacterioferritin-associated ferredoxin